MIPLSPIEIIDAAYRAVFPVIRAGKIEPNRTIKKQLAIFSRKINKPYQDYRCGVRGCVKWTRFSKKRSLIY